MPELPYRKTIRLNGYNYSCPGYYFITICTQHRKHLFGKIVGADLCVCPSSERVCTSSDTEINNHHPIMELNYAGQMVKKWYYELENKFSKIKCDEMIIMPNHIHCIIEITTGKKIPGPHVGAPLRGGPIGGERGCPIVEREYTIGDIVCWFKTMTTNEYIRMVKQNIIPRFDKKIWQRNYWEHIVRDENEYYRISDYIKNNPLKWNNDKLNGGNGNIVMEPTADYMREPWMV